MGLVFAVILVGSARAEDERGATRGSIQAKLSYCQYCHGPAAQGYVGFFPIPRLAGQQPEYLENQLQPFVEHRRTNNVMFNVAHSLSPSLIAALGANFRELNPAPLGGAPRQKVAEGKRIFEVALLKPTLRRVRPATAQTLQEWEKFPAWPGNSIPTSSRN